MESQVIKLLSGIARDDLRELVEWELGDDPDGRQDGLVPRINLRRMSAENLATLLAHARGVDLIVGGDESAKRIREHLLMTYCDRDQLAGLAKNWDVRGRHKKTLAEWLAYKNFHPGKSGALALCAAVGLPLEYAGKPNKTASFTGMCVPVARLPKRHAYQDAAVDEIVRHWSKPAPHDSHTPKLLNLPTGAGKTRTACDAVAKWFLAQAASGFQKERLRVVWIVHTAELMRQAGEAMYRSYLNEAHSGADLGAGTAPPLHIRDTGDGRALEPGLPVGDHDAPFEFIVASPIRLHNLVGPGQAGHAKGAAKVYTMLGEPDLIVIDECHRAEAMTYKPFAPILAGGHNPWRLLGLTATPYRCDDDEARDLVKRFANDMLRPFGADVDEYAELEASGVLARAVHLTRATRSTVKAGALQTQAEAKSGVGGEVAAEVLEALATDPNRNATVVDETVALSLKESVLVFACNVRHARRLAAVLRERGVNAAAVVGETSAGLRRQRVEEFRSGALRVLVSVDLFNTGFDVPKVGALIMARPTFSPVRYMQMLGRGLRGVANGGKPECVVVDLTDNFGRFGDKVVHYDTMRNLWRIQR